MAEQTQSVNDSSARWPRAIRHALIEFVCALLLAFSQAESRSPPLPRPAYISVQLRLATAAVAAERQKARSGTRSFLAMGPPGRRERRSIRPESKRRAPKASL